MTDSPPPLPSQQGDPARSDASRLWLAAVIFVGLLAAVASAVYLWGIPWAARVALSLVPTEVDRVVGDAAFTAIDASSLAPSRLPAEEQQRLRTAFEDALSQADGDAAADPVRVEFRDGNIGPNAFALPGGRVVITDELVNLVQGREDVVIGVLSHELGHARYRHGMRMLVQSTFLDIVIGLVLGDFSPLLARAPSLFGQMAYSRDFERDADREAVRVLVAAGKPPDAMVFFFERLAAHGDGGPTDFGIGLASHPADAERIAFFRAAARR